MRYASGQVGEAIRGLDLGDDGVFNLGSDGVLRSFDSQGNVIDYRQLDPEQVKAFATKEIERWKESDHGVPPQLSSLVDTEIDGRLVTDLKALVNPDDSERPVFPESKGQVSVPRAPVIDELNPRQRLCNPFMVCENISPCTPFGCYACYFPNGPPLGYCFVP